MGKGEGAEIKDHSKCEGGEFCRQERCGNDA